jgi:hypothetical protein
VPVTKERPGTAHWNYLLLPVDNFVLLQQLLRRAVAQQELRKRGTYNSHIFLVFLVVA